MRGRKNSFCASVPNAMIAWATIRMPIGDNDGRPGQCRLPAEDVVLGQAPVAAAVLDRPGRRGPAALVKDPLPFHARLVVGVDAGHEAAGPPQFRCQLCRPEIRAPRRETPGRPPTTCRSMVDPLSVRTLRDRVNLVSQVNCPGCDHGALIGDEQRRTGIITDVERRRDARAGQSPMAVLNELPALVVLERLPVPVLAIGEDGASSSPTEHSPRCSATAPKPSCP